LTETTEPLRDELFSSAVRFAQSGLRAFLDNDFAIFLLHSATALEQLMKAYRPMRELGNGEQVNR
jgi:hypothetical protein